MRIDNKQIDMASYILSPEAGIVLSKLLSRLSPEHEKYRAGLEKSALKGLLPHAEINSLRTVLQKKENYNATLLDILRNAKPCIPALDDAMNGSKGSFSGDGSKKEEELELAKKKRREYLISKQQTREYNKMVFGKDTDPRTDERRERVNNFSNFKNQISIGLNMIVSVFAMFGMGYYICLKMSYSEKTSLIVGLVSAVVIMFIEMVLFIFRAVRVEDSLERKVDDGTDLSADVNVNETSGNGIVTTMRDNGIPSSLSVSSKKTDLVTKKNQ